MLMNMTTTKAAKVDAYEKVTAQILAALEAGTVPWHQPWAGNGRPMSMSTNKPYRGINAFLLGLTAQAAGYESPFWGTYKQIESLGGQVRKGERSTVVVFWKTFTREAKPGEKANRDGEVTIPMMRTFNVFNYCQADNLPDKFGPVEMREHDVIAEAEAIVADFFGRSGAPSLSIGGDIAAYSPSRDAVMLPEMGRFETANAYYGAAFHEMTHSTGHASRLDRPGIVEGHTFGSEMYAAEELVAEMGSAMLAAIVGLSDANLPASAAYIANWLRVLRGDPKMVVKAATAAQKAADLILGDAVADDATTEAEAA